MSDISSPRLLGRLDFMGHFVMVHLNPFHDARRHDPAGPSHEEALSMPGAEPASPSLSQEQGGRVLWIVPEIRLESRIEAARTLAAQLLGGAHEQPKKIVLFLERTSSESAPSELLASGGSSLRVCSVGPKACNRLYLPLSFAVAALNYCRVASVISDPEHPQHRPVLEEAEGKALMYFALNGFPLGRDRKQLVQESLLLELYHFASMMTPRMRLTERELQRALEEMPTTPRGRIPERLQGITLRVLHDVNAGDIQKYNDLRITLEHGMDTRIPKFEYLKFLGLKRAIQESRAFDAYTLALECLAPIRVAREAAYPFFIAREKFDQAVLSCRLPEALCPRTLALLKDQGIRVLDEAGREYREAAAV